ncbi:hypothetical protein AA0114_g6905 [Alternaria tenuissima]|uniref:BTB domain-containing protein n=1 Tax=Alternaria tenuissima TaxID=119927 RepID=A0A4Q4MER9_9PLEO|nr:hypothetical protein AA0114_g6905 [Alternaria tenuissima]
MADNHIILDFSGRKFRTSTSVLSVSPYFESLLTRWEDCADLQADGSYYVDADADTFEHILNFMRRPSRFPLYWNKKDGFDYALYCRVEAEADYFILEGLRDWIRQAKYLQAVLTCLHKYSAKDYKDYHRFDGDVIVEKYVVRKAAVVLCPLGIHGDYRDCRRDKMCSKSIEANGLQMSVPEDELLVAVTSFYFNNAILVNNTP